MNKPLEMKEDKQEITPPGEIAKINLLEGKDPDKVGLLTPGQVKSEMGRVYRAVLRGKVHPDLGRILVMGHLTPILKATEIEQAFNLALDDPDADRPALMGLTILGPGVELPAGAPARRLDGPDKSTTRPKEGKADDTTKT